jgi:hypothetical protein
MTRPTGTFDLTGDTLPWTRENLIRMLELSLGFSTWLKQWQSLGTVSVDAWCEALRVALQEGERARDLHQILLLPANVVQRQLSATLYLVSATAAKMLDDQVQSTERLRQCMGSMWQRVSPAVVSDQPTQSGGIRLDPLAKAQVEWLALTQRWLETFSPGTGASPH